MSLDRREEIIAQLGVIMQSLVTTGGIRNVYRNQTTVAPTQRPAIVVIDGDEEGAVGEFTLGRPPNMPNIIRMSPQVLILAGGTAATVGTAVNGFRLQIIAAVLNDPQLAILVGSNGGIQYQGLVTDLGQGATTEVLAILNFAFHYPLLNVEIVA